MKRIIALFLSFVLVCCGLCGCDFGVDQAAAVVGRWETVNYFTSDSVTETLRNLDLYEEEIALLDPGAIGFVDVIEFNDDKTYTITCDTEKSLAMVDEYFRNVFATFYRNRDTLDDLYEEDLSAMTEAQFQQFYADLYVQSDFDALIEVFVYSITDEEHLLAGDETGTYRVSRGKIWCKISGETEEEYIDFSVEGNTLTLTYSDGTVVYTKQ